MTTSKLILAFLTAISMMYCKPKSTTLDVNCTGKLLVELGDRIDTVETRLGGFIKTLGKNTYGEYVLVTWTHENVFEIKKGFLGNEIIGVDLGSDNRVNKIYYAIECFEMVMDCTGWKEMADKHLLEYFGCIPNLEDSIKELNHEPNVIFTNGEFSVTLKDFDLNRSVIIEKK